MYQRVIAKSRWLFLLFSYNLDNSARLGPPVVPLPPFLGEGSPTKIDYRKKGYPFSTLSAGGPRRAKQLLAGFPCNHDIWFESILIYQGPCTSDIFAPRSKPVCALATVALKGARPRRAENRVALKISLKRFAYFSVQVSLQIPIPK